MSCPSLPPPATAICPEWELLLCSVRSVADVETSARIVDLVRGQIDWNALVELASRHHVIPLLYRGLSNVCPDAVPPATLALLARLFKSNVARNLALTSELLELLKTLAEHKIPAIPFKGPTLAALAYQSLGKRQAGDLDVLVRGCDAIRAMKVLISRGFRPVLERNEHQEFAHNHHFVLVRDDRALTVEIHWRLIPSRLCFQLGDERLWHDSTSLQLAGVDVPCLPTPDLVLYLCAHGAKHCWQRVSWICDMAELMRVERGIDWDIVMGKAREIGAQRMLSLGLVLASDLLGGRLPEPIARTVRSDATVRALSREVLERYLVNANTPPTLAEFWRFNLRARERLRDRIRCRLKFIAPSLRPNARDFAFLRLPSRLSFLYPAVKPVRLAREFALNPAGSFRVIGDLMGF